MSTPDDRASEVDTAVGVDSTDARKVSTDHGPARLLIDRAVDPRAVLALGHGAGGGPEAADLVALAEELPTHGITVVRMEQPWRLAGRRIGPRPSVLDPAWVQALAAIDDEAPLVVGGRSAGARVACRTAERCAAVGCLALAFPLHPPGKGAAPEKDRSGELIGSGVPTLVVQGERDAFGSPDEVVERSRGRGDPTGIRVVPVPETGHEFAVPKRASTTWSEVRALIVARVAEWTLGLLDRK